MEPFGAPGVPYINGVRIRYALEPQSTAASIVSTASTEQTVLEAYWSYWSYWRLLLEVYKGYRRGIIS